MTEHCCETMARQVDSRCDQHDDPFGCPDALVGFNPRFREYGLLVHDRGTSTILIVFCPWCGSRPPQSQRDRWFEALGNRGIDPWQDDIPAEFHDGGWLAASSDTDHT